MANPRSPHAHIDQKPSGRHPVPGVETSTTVFLGGFARGPASEPVRARSLAEFEHTFGGTSELSEATMAVHQFFANGGSDAWILGASNSPRPVDAETIIGDPRTGSGLWGLNRIDLFGLLCIPQSADLDPAGYRKVIRHAIRHCTQRRAFLLIDPPAHVDSVEAMRAWVTAHEDLRDSHAAVYFPRLRVTDPAREGSTRTMAASGALAGMYARVDAAHGVWKAPAGELGRLMGVMGLTYDLEDKHVDVLNPRGVNCLRQLPRTGPVAWGARTFAGSEESAGALEYVPARRLACFLEESIVRGTRWIVFEPNAESLWSRLRANVAEFLHGLYERGAFQGSEPREAYFVKCDSQTNSRTDVEAGFVNLLVGFAPVKASEFVTLPLRLVVGQTS